MEENFGTKTKVSMNFPEEVDFQTYIESVKQRKTPWNIFENVMKDVSYKDLGRLEYLNAILLNELTLNLSDIERSRYLNAILLTEFKEFVYRESNSQHMQLQNEAFVEEPEKFSVDSDWDGDIIKEDSKINIVAIVENERREILEESINDNAIETNQNKPDFEIFPCEFCNKVFRINFHLKQHMRKVHEEKIRHMFENSVSEDCDLNTPNNKNHEGHPRNYNCDHCGKSFLNAAKLQKHTYTVHKGHKAYNCDSCDKTFNTLQSLETHLHTVHDGNKDYKCESCGKSFSQAPNLKRHIQNVHEGHKDYKCVSCDKSFSEARNLKNHFYAIHQSE